MSWISSRRAKVGILMGVHPAELLEVWVFGDFRCSRFSSDEPRYNALQLHIQCGVSFNIEWVRNWCYWFGAQFPRRAKAGRVAPGSTWHLDERMSGRNSDPLFPQSSAPVKGFRRILHRHGRKLQLHL
ncbi:transposase [Cupriavidus taiwanensis]|uniref:Transposase n=1 Tax=Cupriavidus taiwanensis TaxID=164546 RepID=A0A375JDL9_9BURK|nr:transposase [Cupriavidus taiwanensis]